MNTFIYLKIILKLKLLPNTEKVFRYSVKMYWLYRKTFLFGYQYRKSLSVIYADTANRKSFSVIYADTEMLTEIEYTYDDGLALSKTEKLFRLMYIVFTV